MLNTYALAIVASFASATEVEFSLSKGTSFQSFIGSGGFERFYPQYEQSYEMPHNDHRNTHAKGREAKRYATINECRTIIAQFEDCMEKGWGISDQELAKCQKVAT